MILEIGRRGESLCCGVVEDRCKDVYIKSKAIVVENGCEDRAVTAMLDAGLSAADAAMAETKVANVDDLGNVEL